MRFLELRVPPVLVVAIAAALMWVVARALPGWNLDLPGRQAVAALAAILGVAVALAGVIEFRRSRTTVNPLRPDTATSLVDGGIYRLSRNPMYLGFALALLGWGVFLANPAALAVLFGYVAYMNRFQIAPEERALEARFGAAFAEYRAKVRRWL